MERQPLVLMLRNLTIEKVQLVLEGGVKSTGEEEEADSDGGDEEEEAARKNRLGLNKKAEDDDEEGLGASDLDFNDDDDIEKGDDCKREEIFTDYVEAVGNDPEKREDLALKFLLLQKLG